MPGVSTTQPPESRRISSAVVVVCRPFCVVSLTSRTRSPSPGWIAFRSDDLPTPLCPVKTVCRPTSRFRNRSMPSPVAALVSSAVRFMASTRLPVSQMIGAAKNALPIRFSEYASVFANG